MHARVPTCIRIVRHARPRILALATFTLRFLPSPASTALPTPPLSSLHHSDLVPLPSLLRLCIVRLTPPTPEPSRLPPLVSASSRLTLVWLDGPEGSGQFMPNYTLITVMARLRYRWCTELSNCHGPRERGLGSSIGRYDAARRGASTPI